MSLDPVSLAIAFRADSRVVDARKHGARGDGTTDDTAALQAWLDAAEGQIAYLPPGTYLTTATLSVKAGTTVTGAGKASVIQLGDSHGLTGITYRGGDSTAYPILLANADDVTLRDFAVKGHATDIRNHRQFGVAFYDCERGLAENLTVTEINYDPSVAAGYGPMGYCVATVEAQHITIRGGHYDLGGYECIGVADDSHDVLVDAAYSGIGWRTSLQVHRGCTNVRVINCTIRQDQSAAHSALTVHPEPDSDAPIVGLWIANNDIQALVDPTGSNQGGIQFVNRGHNIQILNNRITSNRWGAYVQGTDVVVAGNVIATIEGQGRDGVHLDNCTNAHVQGNTITAGEEAITLRGCTGVEARGNTLVTVAGPGSPNGVIHLETTTRAIITDNDITSALASVRGINVQSSSDDILLRGNRIVVTSTGVRAVQATLAKAVIEGNTVETPGVGILVEATTAVADRTVRITGNIVTASGDYGVRLRTPMSGPIITGNVVKGAPATGVSMQSVNQAIVKDNNLIGATAGVSGGGDNAIISDNLLPAE